MSDYLTHDHILPNGARFTHTHLLEDDDHDHEWSMKPKIVHPLANPPSKYGAGTYGLFFDSCSRQAKRFTTDGLREILGARQDHRDTLDLHKRAAFEAFTAELETRNGI